MPILTDEDMQPFRQLFANLACDQACTITRMGYDDDGYGHKTENPVIITTVNALVQKPSASIGDALTSFAGRIASKSMIKVDFPYGQDIQQKDTLSFTSTPKTFVVQEILNPGSFSISTTVLATEVA